MTKVKLSVLGERIALVWGWWVSALVEGLSAMATISIVLR
jgi:hypothetical protein